MWGNNMSDSDEPNEFTYQNEETTISLRGPNFDGSNLRGLNMSTFKPSSTMQLSRNFAMQRYPESSHDNNMFFRRETSPMSVMSDVRLMNFNNSRCAQSLTSQRTQFGRSRSPMSVRTIDSGATSVTALDIAMALKNTHYSNHEVRLLKDAFKEFVKSKFQPRHKKRRYRRRCCRSSRCRSCYDSGDQTSISSISSDDNSTRSSQVPSYRSTKTNISEIRRKFSESNMYKDCTDSLRQKSLRNKAADSVDLNNTHASINSKGSLSGRSNMCSWKSVPAYSTFIDRPRKPSASVLLLKDRFSTKGYQLGSQRFNRSVASTTIPENAESIYNPASNLQNISNLPTIRNNRMKSDTNRFNITTQNSKSDDSDDIITPPNKKNTINNDKTSDFVFAKPTFPVKKIAGNKFISKSAPLTKSLAQPVNTQNSQYETPGEQQDKDEEEEQSNETHNATDLSMRPSFIKRRLFTQSLDVTEKKNISSEDVSSPQNSVYGAIQKQRHKVRTLQQVTTKSCLNREINDEDNLRDLINKIVPVGQINTTSNQTKSDLQISNNNGTEEDGDKWDITSIISHTQKHDDDLSDTYTDEENLNTTVKHLAKENEKPRNCKVVVHKLPVNKQRKTSNLEKDDTASCVHKGIALSRDTDENKNSSESQPAPTNGGLQKEISKNDTASRSVHKGIALSRDTDENKNSAESQPAPTNGGLQKEISKNGIKSNKGSYKIATFWETEYETDTDWQPPNKNDEPKVKPKNDNPEAGKFRGIENRFNTTSVSMASTTLNNTVATKFNNKHFIMKSHRVLNRKHNVEKEDDDRMLAQFEPQSKKRKTGEASSSIDTQEHTTTHKKTPKGKKQPTQISEPKSINNKKETILNETETNDNKSKKTALNAPKSISTGTVLTDAKKGTNKKTPKKQPKSEMIKTEIKKKTTKKITQNKQIDTNHNLLENGQSTNKQTKNNGKEKLSQDSSKTIKEKLGQKENKNKSPKAKNTSNATPLIDSSANLTADNSKYSTRSLRSCRVSKLKQNLQMTNSSSRSLRSCGISEENATPSSSLCRTLRSRIIDLSGYSTSDRDMTKTNQKINLKENDTSDLSFTLTANKKVIRKRIILKETNLGQDSSNVKFSLSANESLTPKKPNSRVNTKSCKENVTSKLNHLQTTDYDNKLKRKRTSNKKYL